jgi:hypothetical protein
MPFLPVLPANLKPTPALGTPPPTDEIQIQVPPARRRRTLGLEVEVGRDLPGKKRYAAEGLDGLADRPKPGGRRVVDEAAVVPATLEPPPERLRCDPRSSRLLSAELGISHVRSPLVSSACHVLEPRKLRHAGPPAAAEPDTIGAVA